MARVSYEFQIVCGEPDERLAKALTDHSVHGWEIAGVAYGTKGLIVLLKREKDFEVAQSLRVALEEAETVEAVSHVEIPREELDI